MGYEQRLRDDYLANAREYTQSLYVPLHRTLSSLEDAYEHFRPLIDENEGTAPDDARTAFSSASLAFVADVGALLAAGDVFITTQLETRLRRFTAFVAASREATATRQKLVLRYRLVVPISGLSMS